MLLNHYHSETAAETSVFAVNEEAIKKYYTSFQNSLLSLTACSLMAYEQMLKNPFKPLEVVKDNFLLTKNLKRIMSIGLQSSNGLELNVMLLEILFLVLEQHMLSSDELQVITVSVIQCFYDEAKKDNLWKSIVRFKE